MKAQLTPRLVVEGADDAIAFYQNAFGAELLERYADPSGHIVHAALSILGCTISLTEHKPSWDLHRPESRSPVLLHLLVDDVDALGEQMVGAGAQVLIHSLTDTTAIERGDSKIRSDISGFCQSRSRASPLTKFELAC